MGWLKSSVACVLEEALQPKKDPSTVTRNKINNRVEMNVRKRFGERPFSAIDSVAQVVRDNYAIPPLSRALPWVYYCFWHTDVL